MTIKNFFIFTLTALTIFATLGFTRLKSEARERPSIKKVRGEGISFQLEDEQEMRARAIDEALKNAIVSAYESLVKNTVVSKETEERKASVISTPLNYILDYRVLSEGWIRHLVIEPGLPTAPPPPTRAPLDSTDRLSGAGDRETPGDIFANAGGEQGYNEDEEFNEAQEQGLKLFHVWIETSVDFKQLKNDLSLTPSFEGENTSLVTILLLTVNGYDRFTKIKEAIEELANVKEVTLDSFLKGKIVFTTEVWGNPHELLEKLRANQALKDFDIIPSGADRITIKGILER